VVPDRAGLGLRLVADLARGVEGITIFQPGSRVAIASIECEWYRLARMPAPTGVISTIGTFQSPALDQ
jgi:hypothetical protein